MRCKLDRVPFVIAVAFILHNFAKRVGEPDFEGDDEEDEDEDFPDLTDRNDDYLRGKGQEKRQEMFVTLYYRVANPPPPTIHCPTHYPHRSYSPPPPAPAY